MPTCNCPYHAWHELYLKKMGLKWRDDSASGHKVGSVAGPQSVWIKIRKHKSNNIDNQDIRDWASEKIAGD